MRTGCSIHNLPRVVPSRHLLLLNLLLAHRHGWDGRSLYDWVLVECLGRVVLNEVACE